MDKTSFDFGFWGGLVAGIGVAALLMYHYVNVVKCYGPSGRLCIISLEFGIPFITY